MLGTATALQIILSKRRLVESTKGSSEDDDDDDMQPLMEKPTAHVEAV
jgi:hypothetical protein